MPRYGDEFTAPSVRGVVVSRPSPDWLDDEDRPIRITVADSAFAELSKAEALLIFYYLRAAIDFEAK